jgi:hypothetical protein
VNNGESARVLRQEVEMTSTNFAYMNRATDKFFVRVDVTEPFPFLLSNRSPYLDR